MLVVILGIGSTSSLFPDIPEYISYLNVEFSWIVGKNLVCSEPFRAWSFDGWKLSEQRRGCSWVFWETLSSVMVLDHRNGNLTHLLTTKCIHSAPTKKIYVEFDFKSCEKDQCIGWKLHGNNVHEQSKGVVLDSNLYPRQLRPSVFLFVPAFKEDE